MTLQAITRMSAPEAMEVMLMTRVSFALNNGMDWMQSAQGKTREELKEDPKYTNMKFEDHWFVDEDEYEEIEKEEMCARIAEICVAKMTAEGQLIETTIDNSHKILKKMEDFLVNIEETSVDYKFATASISATKDIIAAAHKFTLPKGGVKMRS